VFHVVWAFQVRAGAEAEFERVYGPEGDWARLFAREPGYVRTVLVRDRSSARRYLLTDTWRDRDARLRFRLHFGADYAVLDRACEALMDEERCLGEFEDV
jgi:heme-degrading monooxygenase HmoA